MAKFAKKDTILAKAAQVFNETPESVKSVPAKSLHSILNPSPVLLSIVILELPGIVLVTFVQVSADKAPVSKAYL